ncbi:MAG: hypothetical protein OEZ25_00665 [Candidatus Bathyarchaeota archaeon]|nr:hypothetical protein [Candidatus Bathyarchaeota archaeon]
MDIVINWGMVLKSPGFWKKLQKLLIELDREYRRIINELDKEIKKAISEPGRESKKDD